MGFKLTIFSILVLVAISDGAQHHKSLSRSASQNYCTVVCRDVSGSSSTVSPGSGSTTTTPSSGTSSTSSSGGSDTTTASTGGSETTTSSSGGSGSSTSSSGGAETTTSSSGGSSSSTSSSGGSGSTTSSTGGSETTTSSSGGSETTTSTSGGSETTTSSSGGSGTSTSASGSTTSSSDGSSTSSSGGNESTTTEASGESTTSESTTSSGGDKSSTTESGSESTTVSTGESSTTDSSTQYPACPCYCTSGGTTYTGGPVTGSSRSHHGHGFHSRHAAHHQTEHERIVKSIGNDHVLFDVFAGVGPFAIPVAKKKSKVYANDLNPESYKWLMHNKKLNKISDEYFEGYNMDGRDFILTVLKENLPKHVGKQIVVTMNLPALAVEFLNSFVGLLKNSENISTLTVYVYCFTKGENPEQLARDLIHTNLKVKGVNVDEKIKEIFKVRTVSSMKEMMRVTLSLDKDILAGEVVTCKRSMEEESLVCKKICTEDKNGQKQEENQQCFQSDGSQESENEGQSESGKE
ncbi:uncharacterized protein DDB_G0271670 isoform X2 [Anthonomus grandis grandis]|uniref:uncharacterized protein DDB_G0271670 isoform X2 n=1 Tax=Anthonomus grandis grandis TaxID=2921223 RepID=UPI002165F511|nr:uncharacterized protein DDB_G0271670 isoform X2 [Anthonomus grandis grandis]